MARQFQLTIALLVLFSTDITVAEESNVQKLKMFSSIGKELEVLNGYQEAELLNHEGRGCLTHMWFGGDWPGYERTRIRIYVDDDQSPSIDMELGLGHGVGFADSDAPWGCKRLGKTGHPSGLYNCYRIPFGKRIRVTAQRDRRSPDGAPFWWIVRGTEGLTVSLGGVRLPESARLKLHKVVRRSAERLEEFNLCDVKGEGAVYQVTIAAKTNRTTGSWKDLSFLEACMRAYVDGVDEPIFLSSGLEDYFLGTYYFNRGKYANDIAGLTHLDKELGSFSAYRFHDEDPIFFGDGLRLTCRCGEELGGRVFHEPSDTTYWTYTWIYHW